MLILKIMMFVFLISVGVSSLLLSTLMLINVSITREVSEIRLGIALVVNTILTFLAFYFSASLSWMMLILPAYAVIVNGLCGIWLFKKEGPTCLPQA